jgi:hypothetical protein
VEVEVTAFGLFGQQRVLSRTLCEEPEQDMESGRGGRRVVEPQRIPEATEGRNEQTVSLAIDATGISTN